MPIDASIPMGGKGFNHGFVMDNYFAGRKDRRAERQSERQGRLDELTLSNAEKKQKQDERLQQIAKQYMRNDGTWDRQGATMTMTQEGLTTPLQQLQADWRKKDTAIATAKKAQFDANKLKADAYKRKAVTYSNLPEDRQKAYFDKNMAQKGQDGQLMPLTPQLHSEIIASTMAPQTRKEQFEFSERKRNKELTNRFREEYLPSISSNIENLMKDENARNQLLYEYSQSEFAGLPEAQTFMKALKGKSTDPFAKGMIQMELFKSKWEEEKKRGGAWKPTQYDAAGFGMRMSQVETGMEELFLDEAFDPTTLTFAIMKGGPEILKDGPLKAYLQYQRNFINATLREESGAAIAPSEFDSAQKQYFPQAGDSPKILEQKRKNRLLKQAIFKAEAGGAWDEAQNQYKALLERTDPIPIKLIGGRYEVIEP